MNYERSKAPLALMEQIIMILVFALAAAVCLQAFVYANGLSGRGEKENIAAATMQVSETNRPDRPISDLNVRDSKKKTLSVFRGCWHSLYVPKAGI